MLLRFFRHFINQQLWLSLLTSLILTLTLVLPASAAFTTTTVDSSGWIGNDSSLVLNTAGNPVISYYDRSNGDLKVAVCGNATCTGGNTLTTVDSSGDVGYDTSIELNAAGNPVISYLDASNFDLKVAICGNPTCTSGNTLTTVDSTNLVGSYSSLELNTAGNPVISYLHLNDSDLKVAVCGNPTCTSGNTLTTVDSSENVGNYTSLAINTAGKPVISYYDRSNKDLKVAICGDPTCTSGNTLTTVDSAEDVGYNTSLVLNAADNPVISYYDGINDDLKVAICGDPTCTSGNTLTTVDSVGSVGGFTSLVLNAIDNPVISYHDASNGALKIAICGNATCTSGNILTTVDSSGDVGYDTSLVLNAAGNPVISYFDSNNADLKVAVDVPDMVMLGNSLVINDNDATASIDDDTHFGSILVDGGAITRTFTISNNGNLDLNLTGSPVISLTGTAISDFTVMSLPTTLIAGGNVTTFQVRFDPTVTGIHMVTVSIANNDPDENPYDFAIKGEGITISYFYLPIISKDF